MDQLADASADALGVVFWQFSTHLIEGAPLTKKMKHPGNDRVGRQNFPRSIVLDNELAFSPIAEDACGTTPTSGRRLRPPVHFFGGRGSGICGFWQKASILFFNFVRSSCNSRRVFWASLKSFLYLSGGFRVFFAAVFFTTGFLL
jgi:hypothetical protein